MESGEQIHTLDKGVFLTIVLGHLMVFGICCDANISCLFSKKKNQVNGLDFLLFKMPSAW